MKYLFFAMVMISAFCARSHAGEIAVPLIEIGPEQGAPGTTITLPVVYRPTPGTIVSSIGIDVIFDRKTLDSPKAVLVHEFEADSGVTLPAHSPAPGVFRFAILGLVKSQIPAGKVADLSFTIAATAPKGKVDLKVIPTGSSPDGKPVAMGGTVGGIVVE